MKIASAAVLFVLLGAVSTVAAQTPPPHFGLKVGPTFSNLNIDPEDPEATTGTRWGIGAGGFVVWPLNPRISLQFEGLFMPKGSETSGEPGTEFEGLDGHIVLDYLEFPILLRIDGARSARRSFHAFAGPSLAYNTTARTELVIQGELFDNGISDNIRNEINLFDFGLVVGAGMQFGRYLVVDARYTWGLRNVNDLADDETVVKNRAFTVLAGIRLGGR